MQQFYVYLQVESGSDKKLKALDIKNKLMKGGSFESEEKM